MATVSPIGILEGTDKWQSSTRYGPSSAEMAIEDLSLFLKGRRFQTLEKEVLPSRSESAPPSMEGSIAAIENIFSQRKFTLNRETSLAEGSSLQTHEEEAEGDQSSEQSVSLSVEKTAFSEDSHHSSSLIRQFVHERDADAVKDDARDNFLSSVVGEVDNTHIEAVKSVNLSSGSNSDSRDFHKKEQIVPQNNNVQQSASQVRGTYPQIIYPGISHAYGGLNQFHYGSSSSVSAAEVQPILQSSGFTPPLYASFMTPPSPFYSNIQPAGFFTPQYNMGGYNFGSTVVPSYLAGYHPHQDSYNLQNLHRFYGIPVQTQTPVHMQYFQPHGTYSHQTPRDLGKGPEPVGLPNDHRTQPLSYNDLNLRRGNMSIHYSSSSSRSPTIVSPAGQVKPVVRMNFPGGRYNTNDTYSYSFLEELKSGKGQRFDLSDIAGHIGEFSMDQHGSRFIQQKLETCSVEEKASVFKEIVPHASKLMTDVFGNYVIQKLFEYGSPEERKYLANQLEGLILQLSLQMYGCRVIQKILDVIDLEHKTKLVRELDGHVIRCVRDQNGNHVIQKCIESIPSDNIHFIISAFRGHVPALSMHPYGCRVIQRVLEHCDDESHTQFIVDEILDSVCLLAQDQYGNYVTQHVLERGKPRERSIIIEKLCGSIVQLSQHKFASNVVEKCLEYSDSSARDVLIKEIVGHGDKNDNLLIMMKDQYANYVIQKIIQKCSSDQREMFLGLIRDHLIALKKYTYGKHIVARFEQLYGEEIQTSES